MWVKGWGRGDIYWTHVVRTKCIMMFMIGDGEDSDMMKSAEDIKLYKVMYIVDHATVTFLYYNNIIVCAMILIGPPQPAYSILLCGHAD